MKTTKHCYKKIKEDLKKWKHTPCSWIGTLHIVKVAVLTNLVYRFNEVATKIPAAFIAEMAKLTIKFILNCKIPQIPKTNLQKKNKVGGCSLPNFKIDGKVTMSRTMWCWI